MTYEQIRPDDAFGRTMMANLEVCVWSGLFCFVLICVSNFSHALLAIAGSWLSLARFTKPSDTRGTRETFFITWLVPGACPRHE